MSVQQAEWPLPSHKHLPGINCRPDDGFLERIAESAPPVTDPAKAHENGVWLYGLKLVRAGFYWEAHEVLEPVWFNCRPNSCERHFVQGIIQYANAALKRDMGRENAARRLSDIALGLLRDAGASGDDVMGERVSHWLSLACRLQKYDL